MKGARWLWLSLAVLAADRATKFAIERYTSPLYRHSIISDIVVLVHSQNPGIAFGVFSNSSSPWLAPLLLLSSVAVMALLAWMIVTGRAGGGAGAKRTGADPGRRGRKCARSRDSRRRNGFRGSAALDVHLAGVQPGRFRDYDWRGAGAVGVAFSGAAASRFRVSASIPDRKAPPLKRRATVVAGHTQLL